MLSAFRKIVCKEREVQRLQDNVALALKQILSKPVLDGELITANITPAGSLIAHKLGRVPLGWFIADRTAVPSGTEGHILRVSWDDRNITLKTTGTGTSTVQIWVW